MRIIINLITSLMTASVSNTIYFQLPIFILFLFYLFCFSFHGFCRLRMHNKGGSPVAFVEFQVGARPLSQCFPFTTVAW